MSEWILTVDPNRTYTGEALATYIIDAIFDEGREALYRQIGLGTTADNELDKAKDDLDMSADTNLPNGPKDLGNPPIKLQKTTIFGSK